MSQFTIHHGDCRERLKEIADCSVDSIVTDPPYELGFMGKGWDKSGIAYDVTAWRECLRVLKHGGHLLAFGGSRTYHRLACAVEDAGFEIRDQIQWIYGSGFPKSLDVSKAIDAAAGAEREVVGLNPTWREAKKNNRIMNPMSGADASVLTVASTDAAKQWDGWGTALKPAHEPLVLARKPLIGTVAQNVLAHGTGGLNIDGCRIETDEDRDRPPRTPNTIFGGGNGTNLTASETNALGRWPANVIHDGSDEVVALFPETASGSRFGKYANGTFSSGLVTRELNGDSGSAARFYYTAKASKEDREEGLEQVAAKQRDDSRKAGNVGGDNPRNRGVQLRSNHHPTVKPTDLMRYLCRLVTPPNGIVLDPFTGSGSTGKAAMLEGLRFIGIEKEAEYCELAQRRIEAATKQGLLFGLSR